MSLVVLWMLILVDVDTWTCSLILHNLFIANSPLSKIYVLVDKPGLTGGIWRTGTLFHCCEDFPNASCEFLVLLPQEPAEVLPQMVL